MAHAARRGPLREIRGRVPGEEAAYPRARARASSLHGGVVVLVVVLFLLPPGGLLAGHPLAVRLLPLGAVVHEAENGGGQAEDNETLEDALVAEVVAAVAAHRLPVAARHPAACAAIVLVVVVVRNVVVVVVRVLLQEVGDPIAKRPVFPLRYQGCQ